MSIIRVTHPTKQILTRIELPASKSISNRLLILQAISEQKGKINNLSDAADTFIMQAALHQASGTIDIQNAGTCMRFLTAYFSVVPSHILLQGNERMHHRPIGVLVDALRSLGAEIRYANSDGFPPLTIHGKRVEGGMLKLDISQSSQYASALLLVAPLLKNGLHVQLTGTPSSLSYIELTIHWMRKAGIRVDYSGSEIFVPAQPVHFSSLTVTADWSAVSYWYLIAALACDTEIELPLLDTNDGQPDAVLPGLMDQLGVKTSMESECVILHKTQFSKDPVTVSMQQVPDLVPAFAVLLAALNKPAVLTGIGHLLYKETDRLTAITTELTRCGFDVYHDDSNLYIRAGVVLKNQQPLIHTYGDHRMAMAFAPLALVFDAVRIEEPEVVRKSYPNYWEHLQAAGFEIHTEA